MTNENNDEKTRGAERPAEDKAAEAPSAEARPRRRIARSANTAERPAFAPADEAVKTATPPAAPAADAPAAAKPEAARPPVVRDMRAPRPPQGRAPAGDRGRHSGPRPGGPRRFDASDDLGVFRPGVPRGRAEPAIPDRTAAPPRREGDFRPRRPEGDRPPRRDDRPARPRPAGEARPVAEAKPVVAPKAPPPAPKPAPAKPVAPAAPPPAPKKESAVIVMVPRAREAISPKAQKPALTPKEALAAKTRQTHGKKGDARRDDGGSKEAVTLAAEWVSASWDTAVPAARAAGEAAQALVDAWVAANNVVAIAAVAGDEGFEAAARKAARRALGVLKSRGVEIPVRPQAARPAEARTEAPTATFVPPDPTGAASFTITRREPTGSYRIAEVIVRDTMGVLDAGGGWVSGSQLRDARSRVVGSLGVPPVAVPVEWARHRIAKAIEQTAAAKRVTPLGYERCRELVEPLPASEPAHPVADLEESLTSEKAWAVAPGSGRLHEEAEFRGWMPDRGAVDELLRKLGERIGAAGTQEPDAVAPLLREVMDDAADRFFSPEVRNVIASRMKDAAVSVRARKGDDRATEVLATARAVREAGLITSPPREVGFLVGMFQKAVGALLQQGGGSLRVPVPAGAGAQASAEDSALPSEGA